MVGDLLLQNTGVAVSGEAPSDGVPSGGVLDGQFQKLVDVISRSQHNYRELIDNLDQAVFTVSINGEVRVANRRLCEILGVGFTALIGHNLGDFIECPKLAELRSSMESFITTGSWSGTVLVRLKNDSSLRYFDCWLQAVVEDSRVAGVSGWARDVTTQYESEIRFNELFESLREGVFFATLDGRILDANPALIQMLGYSGKEELKQHNLQELYQNPENRQSAVSELKAKGSFHDRELHLRRKDGSELYCLASGFAVRDTFGRITRLQGTLVDVTERRAIEKKLHQEQEFVRRLVANFPDLIAVFDRQGRFTYVSHSVKDVLGGNAEEYIGDTLHRRAHRDDERKLAEMFASVISANQTSAQVELRIRHNDGGWRVLRVNAGPLAGEDGSITGVVASARDVTESKALEEQLVQKEKFSAMGQMMAGAAHELNNPLTAILGVGELLHERASDDTSKRQLDLVMQQARRAAVIVQNLLAFSRPSAHTRSPVRLQEVVENAVQAAQNSLKQKNIDVRLEAPLNVPSVLGDAKLLTQVFLNIIVNAEQSISATGKTAHPGHIDISLAAVDDRVAVTIVDDGPGIAQENIGKIFDPFFTTKRPGGGSGLGLTIALAVLKEHNGTIDVESAPGSGAAFQVTLPAVPLSLAGNPQPSPAKADAASRETLAGRTALVVDDEESIREILQEGLASRGMKVDTASTAEDALTMLSSKTYDVVLCDFNLPKLSGEAFFNELTKRNPTGMPRFVFITGELVDAERIAQINKKGASILQKPFRVPAVAGLLASLFQQDSKVS